jgi:predicted dehydrogenase
MDALLLCMGTEVEAVTSYSARSQNKVFSQYEYATTSVTILKFSGGRVGKVASVIDCIQPYYFHTHLVGSEGSLLDNKFHSNRIGGLNKHAWSSLSMKMLDSGDVSDHPYQSQFEAFFAALERGENMALTTLSESMQSHRVVLAADRSAELGREVKMSELQ